MELFAERVAFVDELLGELGRVGEKDWPPSLAELFAERLEREPALTGYIRRLLVDGGETANTLFRRLFQTTLAGMESLEAARIVRPVKDDRMRTAFLLANDFAMLLLRREIEQVTGIDPLSREGLINWTSEVIDIYTNGVFASTVAVAASKPSRRRRQASRRPVTAVIEACGLTRTYGGTIIGLDLQVEADQVFGFLGPNGAGKTTTIRMLLALQRPTRGRASVLGLDSVRDCVEIHRRIAYLPGELALYPHMTGRHHIEWFTRARGKRQFPHAEELVERFKVVVDRPAK